MRWYKNLYLGEGVLSKKNKILYKLKHNKLQINIYVIVLPLSNMGIMEIYPSYVLLQNIYKKMDIQVIGVAQGLNECYELAGKIAADCYNIRKDFKISEFFLKTGEGGKND